MDGRVSPMTTSITAPSPASDQHGSHGTTARTGLAAASLVLAASISWLASDAALAAAATEERTVSRVRISLGEEGRRWTLVPTMLDGKVESFVALREDAAYGENLTAVWYRKAVRADGSESWETKAFAEQDQPKAIRAVKDALSLSDATDESWPVAVAPVAAAAPEAMVKGVLETDALAPLVVGEFAHIRQQVDRDPRARWRIGCARRKRIGASATIHQVADRPAPSVNKKARLDFEAGLVSLPSSPDWT